MKGFLIAALLVLPSFVGAQIVTPRDVTNVELTFKSTATCVSVAISSAGNVGSGATQVISSTQTLWGSITVQNRDSAVNLYCSDSVNVSSQAAAGTFNAATGFEIGSGTPGGSANFYIGPGQLWYCVNDSTTKATNATVCKGR